MNNHWDRTTQHISNPNTHTHTQSLTCIHTHTHSLTCTHTHTLSLTHTHTHTHSLSYMHTHSHSLSLTCIPHTHTHSISHMHTHTLSYTLTRMHTHTHSLTCIRTMCLLTYMHPETIWMNNLWDRTTQRISNPNTHTHTHSLSYMHTHNVLANVRAPRKLLHLFGQIWSINPIILHNRHTLPAISDLPISDLLKLSPPHTNEDCFQNQQRQCAEACLPLCYC